MTIEKLMNSQAQHVAVVHAKGFGETPVGPYRNEYAFFMTFNEHASKVVRVKRVCRLCIQHRILREDAGVHEDEGSVVVQDLSLANSQLKSLHSA